LSYSKVIVHIFIVVPTGDVACLEAILEATGPRCCLAVDASGHLPVYYAAYNGHYDATIFFVGVNAPLSVTRGKQALVYAYAVK